MDPESERPLRLFVNPFTMWTQLALKTGEAMWASAHAAAVRANAPTNSPRVAVIPTADAPAPKAQAPAAQPAVRPASVRRASKAARFKATRAKLRSKANAKRRAKR
jgi:hypothetical protein